jgi:hypothetical protein
MTKRVAKMAKRLNAAIQATIDGIKGLGCSACSVSLWQVSGNFRVALGRTPRTTSSDGEMIRLNIIKPNSFIRPSLASSHWSGVKFQARFAATTTEVETKEEAQKVGEVEIHLNDPATAPKAHRGTVRIHISFRGRLTNRFGSTTSFL